MPLLRLPQYQLDEQFVGKMPFINHGYNEIVGSLNEVTFNNTDSGADRLPFGAFVQASSADPACVDILQPGGTSLGVAVATERYEQVKFQSERDTYVVGYPVDTAVGYVRKGLIYVLAEENLTAGQAIFVRTVAKNTPLANEIVGVSIRSDVDGVDGGVADPLPAASVRLEQDVQAGCVALLRVEYKLA